MALEQYKTQILLLHSQQTTLDSLSTGFNDRYSVHCATSGTEALNTLTETPIHVIVSAQDLPGMSGLDAIREAKKRSPDTIGILLVTGNQQDGLEALVGDKEVFQIVRGEIAPDALRDLIDNATKQARLITLSESANDHAANVDEPASEHIVMETSENGSAIISDGTGTMPALKPQKVQISPTAGGRTVDVLVLTKDEEFLATIKDSSRGLHNVHHATTPTQAEEFVRNNKVGVLVTDAAMVGSNIEILTQRLRSEVPRMVAVVAGRRDDGELLMDLINRGQVYRFLLKPVSPGRARLAIEASVKHHLEAPDSTFKNAQPAAPAAPKKPAAKPAAKPPAQKRSKAVRKPAAQQNQSTSDTGMRKAPTFSATPAPTAAMDNELDDAFGDDASFTETMTGIAIKVGKSISGVKDSIGGGRKEEPAPPVPEPVSMGVGDSGGIGSMIANRKIQAGVGAVVVVGLLASWIFSGTDDTATPAEVTPRTMPVVAAEEAPLPLEEPVEQISQPTFSDILEEARFARDAGQLITPQGNSALDLYVAAVAASSGDATVAAEFEAVLNQVFGIVEVALLDQRTRDAEIALNAVRSASPANPRLSFLDAQLAQQTFRASMDQARVAIRDGRFEDAGQLLSQVQAVRDADFAELDLLTEELANARSDQRIDEVIVLASQRLEEGRLTSPSNDNARYYYELAISNDPANTAAQQGLIIVAGRLVLDARAAIDAGNLGLAGTLLADASQLDPASDELVASSRALEDAYEEQARAEQQAEADRQAALNAEAAAAQQAALNAEAEAEAERLAAAERQAQADRDAAARQAEEERRIAAAAAAAAAVAASASSGDSAAGLSSTQSTSTPAPQSPGTDIAQSSTFPIDGVSGGSPPQVSSDGSADAALVAAATAAGANLAGNAQPVEDTAAAVQASPQTTGSAPQQQQVQAPPVPSGPESVGISELSRIKYVPPKYPRNAMRRNLNGSVDLKFTVAIDGTVYNVDVLDSTPGTVFDEAAIDAVTKWRFEPVIENGTAVEKRTGVRMAFALE